MSEELIVSLEGQERDLVFDRFDESDAWRLGSLLVSLAEGRPVAIDIRRGSQQLFHAALKGAVADNDRWIERKIRVVERLNASSYLVGRRMAVKGTAMDAAYGVDPADFATHGGGRAGGAQDDLEVRGGTL